MEHESDMADDAFVSKLAFEKDLWLALQTKRIMRKYT